MWSKSYSKTVQGISTKTIWSIWSDFALRTKWDLDTEWVRAEGPFQKGSIFYMKPAGGPKIKMEISECSPNQRFTDCYRFLGGLAKLYGVHDVEETQEGLKLTTTIEVVGPLGWVLRKLVGEKVVAELPAQTDALIQLAKTFT